MQYNSVVTSDHRLNPSVNAKFQFLKMEPGVAWVSDTYTTYHNTTSDPSTVPYEI